MSMRPNMWQEQSNKHIALLKEEHAKEIANLQVLAERQTAEIKTLNIKLTRWEESYMAQDLHKYKNALTLSQKELSEKTAEVERLKEQLREHGTTRNRLLSANSDIKNYQAREKELVEALKEIYEEYHDDYPISRFRFEITTKIKSLLDKFSAKS